MTGLSYLYQLLRRRLDLNGASSWQWQDRGWATERRNGLSSAYGCCPLERARGFYTFARFTHAESRYDVIGAYADVGDGHRKTLAI